MCCLFVRQQQAVGHLFKIHLTERRAVTSTTLKKKALGVVSAAIAATALITPAAHAQTAPQIKWVVCPSDTVTNQGMECGEIQVPMDYSKPQGQKITVGFIRNKAPQSRGALFTNPGGPGGDAYSYVGSHNLVNLKPVENEWDIIGVQPRGLRGSTGLDCIDGAVRVNPLESIFNTGAYTRKACADKDRPGYLNQITTANTARDWEEVRKALGYERINILGLSYGTVLGSVYASTFPQHTDKVVLDSGVSPNALWNRTMSAQEAGYYGSLYAFFDYVAHNNAKYGLGTTAYKVYQRWNNKIYRESGARPTMVPPKATLQDIPRELRGGGQVAVDAFNSTQAARVQAEGLGTQISSGGKNQAMSPTLQLTRVMIPMPTQWEMLANHINGRKDLSELANASGIDEEAIEYTANARLMQNVIICNENQNPDNPLEWPRAMWTNLVTGDLFSAPPALFASGSMCAGTKPVTKIPALNGASLATKPLQIQATNDPQTPYHLHGSMARAMGSTVVTVNGSGHGHVGLGNAAVDELVAHYLRTGEVTTTRVAGLHS